MSAAAFDVVIVGGAAVGSAVAFFLAQDPGFRGRLAIVERDPSFRDCATARSLARTPSKMSVSGRPLASSSPRLLSNRDIKAKPSSKRVKRANTVSPGGMLVGHGQITLP